jgi:hypothetical protein
MKQTKLSSLVILTEKTWSSCLGGVKILLTKAYKILNKKKEWYRNWKT